MYLWIHLWISHTLDFWLQFGEKKCGLVPDLKKTNPLWLTLNGVTGKNNHGHYKEQWYRKFNLAGKT